MLFNSLNFLFVFLPVTYFVFWKLKSKNQRYVWLTASGYIFYSFWNYKFCALMAFSTAFAAVPLTTDDADPVDLGHLQLNSGLQFSGMATG